MEIFFRIPTVLKTSSLSLSLALGTEEDDFKRAINFEIKRNNNKGDDVK